MTSQLAARRPSRMTDESGVRFGIATAALALTTVVTSLAGLGRTDSALAIVVVAGFAAAALRPLLAPVVGLIGWALYTGFVQNGLGQLTLTAADLARLAGIAATTAVLAYGVRNAVGAQEIRNG